MKNKIFIIYPSTFSTNFEISRLDYWLRLKSESIKVFPVPIYANKISLDHDKFALREIKSKLDQNKSDNLIIVFIKSSLILLDQFKLINILQKYSNSIRTILSLGDEYKLSLNEIEINKILYDRVILYNYELFLKINKTNKNFFYFPIIGKKSTYINSKALEDKSNKYVFIGKAYNSRIKIARKIIKKNRNCEFIFAGQGWRNNLSEKSNVHILDWLKNEEYSELLFNNRFFLILDIDESGEMHVTSKLPDAISHNCIPVFLDHDPRIKKLNPSIIYKIDTAYDTGKIIEPENKLSNQVIYQKIRDNFSINNYLDIFYKDFLNFVKLEPLNKNKIKMYNHLNKLKVADLIETKGKFLNVEFKDKEISFTLRIFGLRIPKRVSKFIFSIFGNKSKNLLFIESSGIDCFKSVNLLPKFFINFFKKIFYQWV